MGGLCSLQLFWKHQNIFGKTACLSNSFWVDDKSVFKMVREIKLVSNKFRLYLDCGDAEKEIIADNKKMNTLLRKIEKINDDNYCWNIEKGAAHSEIDWAKRLYKPLTFLFNCNY
jgi:predicted alpha/beta superfamily hydrolase